MNEFRMMNSSSKRSSIPSQRQCPYVSILYLRATLILVYEKRYQTYLGLEVPSYETLQVWVYRWDQIHYIECGVSARFFPHLKVQVVLSDEIVLRSIWGRLSCTLVYSSFSAAHPFVLHFFRSSHSSSQFYPNVCNDPI